MSAEILKYIRSPLSIIAVFALLIEVIAINLSPSFIELLSDAQRGHIVYFIIFFPAFVFLGFIVLVIWHPEKLYAPSDYQNEENFLKKQQAGENSKTPRSPEFGIQDSDVVSISKDLDGKTKEQAMIENFGGNYTAVLDQIAIIKEDIKKRLEGASKDKIIEILISHLGTWQFIAWCESQYRAIFGSQIKLLRMMMQSASKGMEKPDVEKYVEKIILEQNALKDWNVKKYMAFLLGNNLVSEEKEQYKITERGHAFLVWMLDTGQLEDKAL